MKYRSSICNLRRQLHIRWHCSFLSLEDTYHKIRHRSYFHNKHDQLGCRSRLWTICNQWRILKHCMVYKGNNFRQSFSFHNQCSSSGRMPTLRRTCSRLYIQCRSKEYTKNTFLRALARHQVHKIWLHKNDKS